MKVRRIFFSFFLGLLVFSFWMTYSSLANQTSLYCVQNGAGPDDGYRVLFSQDQSEAQVEEMSIAGAKTVGRLLCSVPAAAENDPHPPLALKCVDTDIEDGGYALQVGQAGADGTSTAQLVAVSLAGSTPLTTLTCAPREIAPSP